jgi:hypothetical protein
MWGPFLTSQVISAAPDGGVARPYFLFLIATLF